MISWRHPHSLVPERLQTPFVRRKGSRISALPGMHLNVGCGEFSWPGWVNMDLDSDAHRSPELVGSLTDLPEEAVDLGAVYCGHVLEHLPMDEVVPALKGLRARMRPGGELLAVGPDVDRAEHLWKVGQLDQRTYELAGVGGGERWPGDHHYWACTEGLLVTLLREAGFTGVHGLAVDALCLAGWPVSSYAPWQAAVHAIA